MEEAELLCPLLLRFPLFQMLERMVLSSLGSSSLVICGPARQALAVCQLTLAFRCPGFLQNQDVTVDEEKVDER